MPDHPTQSSKPAYCETGRPYLRRTSGLARVVVGRVADGDAHAAEAPEVHLAIADRRFHEDAAPAEVVDGSGGLLLDRHR